VATVDVDPMCSGNFNVEIRKFIVKPCFATIVSKGKHSKHWANEDAAVRS
jgi:hypothetical protein